VSERAWREDQSTRALSPVLHVIDVGFAIRNVRMVSSGMPSFCSETIVSAPIERVWTFHAEIGNLVRVFPLNVRPHVLKLHETFQPGSEFVLRLGIGFSFIHWHGRIVEVDPPTRFVDRQIAGPFAYWRHEHCFEPLHDGRTRLTETIDYRVTTGPLGALLDVLFVRWQLRALSSFRTRALQRCLHAP